MDFFIKSMDLIIDNKDKIIAVVIWFLPIVIGIWQFWKTQKQSLEIEKLKNQLELEKSQKLLNDGKFRKTYEEFVDIFFNMLHKDKKLDNTQKGIVNLMKTSILFAGPKTIKSFGLWRKEAGSDNTKDIGLYMEQLLFDMRKDLGVSNDGLEKYDILQTFIIGDVKKELDKILLK